MSSVDEKSTSVTKKLEHNLLTMQLDLFSNLINDYPYCLEKDSWKLFQTAQKNLISNQALQSHLILLLDNCLQKLKSKKFVGIFRELQKGVCENSQLFLDLEKATTGAEYKNIYERCEKINTFQTQHLQQLKSTLDIELQTKISKLKKNLDLSFSEVMRLQRTIMLYQHWKIYLVRFQEELPKDVSTWKTKTDILHCVTYTKKAFFKDFLSHKQERALYIDMEVNGLLAESKAQPLFDTLYLKSEILEAEVSVQEALLQKNIRLYEKICIRLALAVMQQPDFQFGDRGFDSVIHQMDKFPDVPYVGDKLHPVLKTSVQKGIGFVCLVGGLWGASLLGYGHHLIAAFNRVIDADITIQLKIGKYLDRWMKTHFFRCDAIGIIEKDHVLQWLMGLGLSVGVAFVSELFVLESVLPITLVAVTVAYIAATLSGRAANGFMDYVGEKMHIDSETLNAIKLIVHMMLYSVTYQRVLDTTHFSLVEFNKRMKARDILGCSMMTSNQELKESFKSLLLKYHPDHCSGVDCARLTKEVIEAREVLGFK